MPETCLPYDEDLSALLDGELPPARAAQVQAHSASCVRCAAQLAALRRANERVVSALRATVSGEDARIARVEGQLRARLAREAETGVQSPKLRQTPAPRRQRNRRWIALAATGLAAAAALGLALLFQARTPLRVAPTPPPPIAQTPPAPLEQPPAVPRVPETVAELPAAKPVPARPRPPVPQPERVAPPLPSAEPEIDLAAADEEDIELASHLDMLEDFEVIQKLDLLERLQKAEDGAGSG